MKHLLLIPTTLISTASATETRLSKSSEARVPESVVDGAENFYRSDKVDRAEGHVPQPIEREFYDFYRSGDKAHSREFKRAAEPKELYLVPNAGHVDLYDRVNPIPRDKLHSFFDQHLGEVRAAK
jgi:arylsulfatase A-like enzyme